VNMPGLKVITPGLRSLVQDTGRTGYQRYGVSVSGAMDGEALLLGNRLAGNDHGAAAVEVTIGGAEFEFLQSLVFAVTGADLGATLDGIPVPVWESLIAPPGAVLRFSGPVSGVRAYVCVAGGIATEPALGSRSTHAGSRLGGLDGGQLKPGDIMPVGPARQAVAGLRVPAPLLREHSQGIALRTVPGGQAEAFSGRGIETFYGSEYAVTERSDRQGVRLDGPVIESASGRYDIVSDAVVRGAVQVPGDGKPIVLMADRQTTGGYAKIAVVASVDLPLVAQAAPGTKLRFTQIGLAEAQRLARLRRAALRDAKLEMTDRAIRVSLKVGGEDVAFRLAAGEGEAVQGAVAASRDGGDPFAVMVDRR
jgi:antagonist of KipI